MFQRLRDLKNLFMLFKFGLVCFTYVFNQISWTTFISSCGFIVFLRFVVLDGDCDMVLRFAEKFGKNIGAVKGKVIWITGASSGFGEALALILAKKGAKLILSARSEDKLNEVRRRCIDKSSLTEGDVLVLPFDITHYDKHEWALESILTHFEKLDVLVSNPGKSQRASWESIEISTDKEIFELNTFSIVNLARVVTRHFITVGEGQHVVMSSAAGVIAMPLGASYAASKHALHGYFNCLRMEHGCNGISVTLLCPGPFKSQIATLGQKASQLLGLSRKEKMMSAERCAQLSTIAMVNHLSTVWIAQQPNLTALYLNQYLPTVLDWVETKISAVALVDKFRGSVSPKTD